MVRSKVRAGAPPAAASAGRAAIAGRIGRELVGIDRRCQRALIEPGARDVGVRDRLRARHDVDGGRGDIREIQRSRLLAAPMRELELVEKLRRPRPVRFGHREAQRDARDAALVAVDQDRRHRGLAGLHAVRAKMPHRLFLDGRERDAVHAPHPRQPRGQLHAGIQRPLIVSADHDEAVAAAERRGDCGDQALAGLERRDVERLRVDEPLHEAVRAADENRDADRGRLRHVAVADDERQRQRRGFVAEARREIAWRPRHRPAWAMAGTMTRAATGSARPSPLVSRVRLVAPTSAVSERPRADIGLHTAAEG